MADPKQAGEATEGGSYKVVPEDDTEYQKQVNSNMVRERDNCADGADERMFQDEEKKLSAKSDLADVKFIADQHNGDTKVDILEVKQTFTGLTKEELMKYCNDPFWVRLRWFMFILFWVIWFGMLAGAIYIIMMANKCDPPAPKTWWQKGPLIDLDLPDESFNLPQSNSSAYFASLEDKIPWLKFAQGVIISKGLNMEHSYTEYPFNASGFNGFATKAKAQNIRTIVDLVPNYVPITHDWFTKSELKINPYTDYFIWGNPKTSASDEKLPPNNWVSLLNESAWSYSANRQQYYLHQITTSKSADLNFHNPAVVKEFENIIESWLNNGASGIRLSGVKHLLVNMTLEDEIKESNYGFVHTDYLFYNHDKTANQPELSSVVNQFKDVVYKFTDNQGLLMTKEEVVDSVKALQYNNTLLIDLPRASRNLMKDPIKLNATSLLKTIQTSFNLFGNESWPSWQFNDVTGNVTSEFRIITALLPGVPVVSMNQISHNSSELDEEYRNLIALRALPSIMYGGYNSSLLADDFIFSYTRQKSGNPGFIVLYNTKNETVSADITKLHKIPEQVTVNLKSNNYNVQDVNVKGKLSSQNITVSAKSVIILSYVQEE